MIYGKKITWLPTFFLVAQGKYNKIIDKMKDGESKGECLFEWIPYV